MPPCISLKGQRFGRLVVIKRYGSDGHVIWKCRCDCGKSHNVRSNHLRLGLVQSCGCFNQEKRSERAKNLPHLIKHGMLLGARTNGVPPEYRAWALAKDRCYNKNCKDYKNYGARGIRMCSRWRNSFAEFFKDVGPKPSNSLSIDRWPDNDGNYEPGNVRWATKSQQQSNQRKRSPYRTNKKGKFPKGVKAERGKFTARTVILGSGGKMKHLGTFNSIDEAAQAVREAER
jgi:hypothetical protein